MQMQEGKQYFVNRITFTGNTTTRDNVIRREMRLFEGGVFNTEALKYSVRRLNQLGYFKPLEGRQGRQRREDARTPKNKVDVTLKLEEQNRNQLTFGAGVSQFEGFFGQLSFQTANFLGRGESLTVSLQGGSRAQNYQLAFTEPFLFDRNITGGIDVFKRRARLHRPVHAGVDRRQPDVRASRWPTSRACSSTTASSASRCSTSTRPTPTRQLLQQQPVPGRLAAHRPGRRADDQQDRAELRRTTPSTTRSSRRTGRALTASFDFAGLGRQHLLHQADASKAWASGGTRRACRSASRAQFEYIRPYGDTKQLPIFEKLFLGGEYSIRGFDIRTVGPRDINSGVVLGGNKSLLFNAEYITQIAGPVRLVLFYDAGQVRDIGEPFGWQEDILEVVPPPPPLLIDPLAFTGLVDPNAPGADDRAIGRQSAFKTSTGAEIRFFMPVLNVPFRLIFAYNPQRGGVLDNNLQPAQKFTFRFAVGSTF